jgi:hypothetical protein
MIYSYSKTNEMTLISQIYFWNRTPHVSDSFYVHNQESSTVHTASSQHNLCDVYLLLCVLLMMDRETVSNM